MAGTTIDTGTTNLLATLPAGVLTLTLAKNVPVSHVAQLAIN